MPSRAAVTLVAVLIAAFAATCAAQASVCNYYSSPVNNGYSSWYNSWGSGGGCGNVNQPIPTGLTAALSAAINQNEFFTGRICGMCLKVNSVKPVAGNTDPNPFPATPFIVYINDVCLTCITNQLDFYNSQQIGNNWNLNWTAVDCPVGNNNVQIQFKDGTNPYYFIVVPIRQKVAITNVEIQSGGTFYAMTKNTNLNGQWEWQLPTGQSPLTSNPVFRLTGCTGEKLVVTSTITIPSGGLSATQIANTDKNFVGYGTTTPAPTTTAGATTATGATTAAGATTTGGTTFASPATGAPTTTTTTTRASGSSAASALGAASLACVVIALLLAAL